MGQCSIYTAEARAVQEKKAEWGQHLQVSTDQKKLPSFVAGGVSVAGIPFVGSATAVFVHVFTMRVTE